MNHGLKINGNILEITLPENIHIDKVIVNRQIFSQRMQVCKSCKYHGLEGHEEPCVSCEVGNSNYVPSVGLEERTEERTETHACDCISRQDAINAFEPDHPVDWYTTMIVDVLEDLPSAEPEIIRCKNCKHKPHTSDKYDYDNGDCGFEIIFPDYRCPCRCEDEYYNRIPDDDWYCGNAERRTDE